MFRELVYKLDMTTIDFQSFGLKTKTVFHQNANETRDI